MYLKISTNSEDISLKPEKISLNLANNEEIIDIIIIDENKLLITTKSASDIKGIIYNFKKNKILKIIEK